MNRLENMVIYLVNYRVDYRFIQARNEAPTGFEPVSEQVFEPVSEPVIQQVLSMFILVSIVWFV